MQQVSNPHDRFFRRVVSQPEAAHDFIRYYLPPDVVSLLDLDTLETTQDSFVDAELRQHFADLLYKVRLLDGSLSYIYVLFEHKSYPDHQVAFQMLRYMVRIWERNLQQHGSLLPIMPVVVYHGTAEWRVGLDLSSLFHTPPELEPYTPNYQFWLCDLSRYSDDEIKGAVLLQMTLLALKYALRPDLRDRLNAILALGVELSHKQSGLEYFATLLRYLVQASDRITENDLQDALEEALPGKGEQVMTTIAEQWLEQGIQRGLKQGLARGMEQGQQLGIREGLLTGIEVALEIRFGDQGLRLLPEIAQIQDVNVLRTVHRGIAHTKTIDDLRTFYTSYLN